MKISTTAAVAIFTALGLKTAKNWTKERLEEKLNTLNQQANAETVVADQNANKHIQDVLAAIEGGKKVEVVEAKAAAPKAAAPAAKPATPVKKAPAKKAAPAPEPEPELELEAEPEAELEEEVEAELEEEVEAELEEEVEAEPEAELEGEELEVEVEPEAAPEPSKKKTVVTNKPGGQGVVKKKAATPVKKAAKKAPAPKAPESTLKGVRHTRSRPYLAGIIIKNHTMEKGVTAEMVAELDEAYGKANEAESMFCLRNAWHAIRGFITEGNEDDLTQGLAAE